MPSYLDRYRSGERAQVWRDLVALGAAVFDGPLEADARAVAQETMRRARHNVELVTGRLRALGFRFAYPDEAHLPPSPAATAAAEAFERQVGRLPMALRAWIDQVGTVNWMGNHPRLCHYFEPGASLGMAALGTAAGGTRTVGLGGLLQEADSLLGRLDPQSGHTRMLQGMRGLIQQLGGGFAASAPAQAPAPPMADEDRVASDPLVVDARELSVELYEEWGEMWEGDCPPFQVDLAPDLLHKAGESGGEGPALHLPAPAADAPLVNTEEGAISFVEYLRLSFEWGGFPGLRDFPRRDEAVLAQLREGLEPL